MGFHRSGLLLFLALIWVKATSFDAEALLMPLILSRRLQLVSWTRPTTSQQGRQSEVSLSSTADEDGDADLSLDAFQAAKGRTQENVLENDEFDGYALRDVIVAKWGKCYDVDFNRVQSFGFKKVGCSVRVCRRGGFRPEVISTLFYIHSVSSSLADLLERHAISSGSTAISTRDRIRLFVPFASCR
jgi:hypothetical protein